MPGNQSLAVRNANIITLDPERANATAMYVDQGRIAALGSWLEVEPIVPAGTRLLDLAGATLVPGLIDTHMHLAHTGLVAASVNMVDAGTIGTVLERVRQAASQTSPGKVIFCTQIDDYHLLEKRYPTLRELDEAAPGHPVVIVHRTGHSSVMNSLALERARIPPDVPGVVRDPLGQPTGLIIAQANGAWRDTLEEEIIAQVGYTGLAHAAAGEAVSAGLTTIHALDNPDVVQAVQPVLDDLPLRVLFYPQTRSVAEARDLGLPRIGGCGPSGLDGDFGPMTAALLQPYAANPQTSGCLYFDDEELEAMVLEAHRLGLQVSMHAVGDRAVAQGLSAVKRALRAYPHPDTRHRIEHWEVFNADLAKQARELGVMVAVQPSFNHFWPHVGEYPNLLGRERIDSVDPIADLVNAGLVVAGGSDSPVTPLGPLLGMHSAVNHSNPAQRVSPLAAFEMFTIHAARIAFEEAEKGTLQVGKLGDFTVLGEDPLSVDPERIKDIPVLYTIVGGEVVYKA